MLRQQVALRPTALYIRYLCSDESHSHSPQCCPHSLVCLLAQACAAYIGCYVARCNHLTREQMSRALEFLAQQAHAYLAHVEVSQHFPDAEMHALFYTICQAILYALCYKRDFLCGDGDSSLAEALRLNEILHCPLKPLKFLLDAVVREFAKIGGQVGVHGYDAVLEDDGQHVLPTRAQYGGENRIENFFPFDPYLLRYSYMFINNLYQEWNQDNANDDMSSDASGDYDRSDGLSISSSIPSNGVGSLGMSLDIRSLSATLEQEAPHLSLSSGHDRSGQSPGFGHIVKRP